MTLSSTFLFIIPRHGKKGFVELRYHFEPWIFHYSEPWVCNMSDAQADAKAHPKEYGWVRIPSVISKDEAYHALDRLWKAKSRG